MKELRLSEYLEIMNPKYSYLKITPNNSIRNQGTDKISKTITLLYTNICQAIRVEESKVISFFGRDTIFHTKFSLSLQSKVTYYIYMEQNRVEFYFIIPQHYLSLMSEKIRDAWPNLTLTEIEELPRVSDSSISYQLLYKHEDGLSLETDKRTNNLITSNLNLLNILQEGDKAAIIYNFMPVSQYGWQAQYKSSLEKLKKKESTLKNKFSLSFLIKTAVDYICATINFLAEPFSGVSFKSNKGDTNSRLEQALLLVANNNVDISTSTLKKGQEKIIHTQIIIQSDSQDKIRQRNNLKGLAQSYDVISSDNSLIPIKVDNPKDLTKFSLAKKFNKMSTSECSNFIALPGRELLEEYKCIDKIDITETQLPDDLTKGVMCIGEVTYRGHTSSAYLSTDKNYQFLSLCIIGPSRAGKSNLIGHLSIDAIHAGECVIIFDFCGNCELSQSVSANIDKDKILTIDCSDMKTIQGLGYNEIRKTNDIFEQYRNAKEQANQLLVLINTVNSQDKELAPRMERYLTAAAIITFICNGSIKDVFNILQNHVYRAKFVENIPENQLENVEEYLLTLFELDVIKDGQVTDTSFSKIDGILDRLHKLKRNSYLEVMIKKDTDSNIDLVNEMQKNQLICLKMPEVMFKTDEERDIYCTYWLTKIWLSLQIRKNEFPAQNKRRKVNIVIDEIYQVEKTEILLKEKLSRLAKFSAKPIISCHYINQMKSLREELRSANTSYLLVSGCDSKNYTELKSELSPYTEDDLLRLKPFHSLNYIKSKNGYAKFVAKLPPELPF